MPRVYAYEQRLLIARFVWAVEDLRQARRVAWQSRSHPEAKRFTQAELRDLACPSYHHLLAGTTGQLPSRRQVQLIADYLDCTLSERNELLLSAEYLPERIELSESQYGEALDEAHGLLHALPLPGAVLTRGWQIVAANPLFHALHGIEQITAIPESQRSAIHYLFDPTLPFRPLLGGKGTVWESNVTHVLPRLQVPALFHNEPWYRNALDRMGELPDFKQLWQAQSRPEGGLPGGQALVIDTNLIRFAHIQISVLVFTSAFFPALVVGVPIDDAARHSLAALGAPTLENRWEDAG